MKTLLRVLITLLLVLWLGGVLFFPAVAWIAFSVLPVPQAGLVVRQCLLTLHTEGLSAGSLLLLLLLGAGAVRAYGRSTTGPLLCTVAMLLLTGFSQWSVMPRMEADRLAVGGDIGKVPAADPHRVNFNQLHRVSEELEEGVLVAGMLMIVLLARPGSDRGVGLGRSTSVRNETAQGAVRAG